jgi:DNA-binding transcriptional ArsR family regulator
MNEHHVSDAEMTSTFTPSESSTDDFPRLDAKTAASVAMALGHRLRMQLLCKLMTFGQSGLSAGTLSAQLKIVPSSLSFHLQQMTRNGVLRARHDGRSIYYSVNIDGVAALRDFLAGLTEGIEEKVWASDARAIGCRPIGPSAISQSFCDPRPSQAEPLARRPVSQPDPPS